MRIDRVELFHVAMPLIDPWRTAYGEDAAIEPVFVKMTSSDEHGWGEAAPFAAPWYGLEWAGGEFAVVKNWLARATVGRNVDSWTTKGTQRTQLFF